MLNYFHRLPPGPVGLPFLGVVKKLDPSKVIQTIQEWKETYGDIFSFTLPGQSVVVVSFIFQNEICWFFLLNKQ